MTMVVGAGRGKGREDFLKEVVPEVILRRVKLVRQRREAGLKARARGGENLPVDKIVRVGIFP